MIYDTVIIGGGMSALLCGIKLIKAGQSVAIVSTGQSALHFNAGGLSLFNNKNGKDVTNPLEAIADLPPEHPYSKVGIESVKRLATEVKTVFAEAGITLNGSEEANHYRLTPTGMFKPVWLSMKDYAVADTATNLSWGRVAVINIKGYVDFYPEFISAGLEKAGLKCDIREVSVPEIDRLRKSSSEMRATTMARALTTTAIGALADEVNRVVGELGAETAVLPAVIGLFDEAELDEMQQKSNCEVRYVSTMPMSLGGMRAQLRLRHCFKRLGGIYMLGDTVTGGKISDNRLESINTVNLGDMPLSGRNFVLATGSFFSHGIVATATDIVEPIFGLDVNASGSRDEWYRENLYDNQAYMKFGVVSDADFFVSKDGHRIENFRAVGAVLDGHDALKEGSGGGVAAITALKVAELIING